MFEKLAPGLGVMLVALFDMHSDAGQSDDGPVARREGPAADRVPILLPMPVMWEPGSAPVGARGCRRSCTDWPVRAVRPHCKLAAAANGGAYF